MPIQKTYTFPKTLQPGFNAADAAAAASESAARKRKKKKEKANSNGNVPGSWYPGSTGTGNSTPGKKSNWNSTSNTGSANSQMPTWKAQMPIEVFEDNDVRVDAKSGAEKLGGKHRYHVGDSKRRKSIDMAGFRDDTAIPDREKKPMGGSGPSLPSPFGFTGFGEKGSGTGVPYPSPLGLASSSSGIPGSSRQNTGSRLLRQSSVDSADLREFHNSNNGAVPSSPFASPPHSPSRARRGSDNGFRFDEHDTPSRPSSPGLFGGGGSSSFSNGHQNGHENPDSVRTWGASDAAMLRPVARKPVGTSKMTSNSGRPPRGGLHRSQSMSSFADEAEDERNAVGQVTPLSSPTGKTGMKVNANGAGNGSPGKQSNGESRPAIWDVFGSERDRASRK